MYTHQEVQPFTSFLCLQMFTRQPRKVFVKYITFMHYADAFIQSDLHVCQQSLTSVPDSPRAARVKCTAQGHNSGSLDSNPTFLRLFKAP